MRSCASASPARASSSSFATAAGSPLAARWTRVSASASGDARAVAEETAIASARENVSGRRQDVGIRGGVCRNELAREPWNSRANSLPREALKKALFHRDDVARINRCIEIDLDRRVGGVAVAHDENLAQRSPLLEASGDGYRLAHRKSRLVRKAAVVADLPVDEKRQI